MTWSPPAIYLGTFTITKTAASKSIECSILGKGSIAEIQTMHHICCIVRPVEKHVGSQVAHLPQNCRHRTLVIEFSMS
jgi:hypothetical protein